MPRQQGGEGPSDTQTERGGSWSYLSIIFGMVMLGWVSVLYVSDTTHPAYIATLIVQSIVFGIATARLPPVHAWLGRRGRAHR